MFEVGRSYEIHTLEDTTDGTVEGYSTSEVIEWDGVLLKIKSPAGEEIVNTRSNYFLRAVKRLEESERTALKWNGWVPGDEKV